MWVIAIETISIDKIKGEVNLRSNGDDDRISKETKLMWMPGVKPVKQPNKMPKIIAKNISNNIKKNKH